MKIKHKFVDIIPEKLEPNIIYISLQHCTAIHLCTCGCGNEVVTPISPNDWSLTFNGKTVSLSPSIGNWQLPCRSHYWIRNSSIIWSNSNKYIKNKDKTWFSMILRNIFELIYKK